MIQKPIKFDLRLSGRFVRNLEELRENFNSEIVDVFRSGLLTKWLYHRDRSAFDAVKEISPTLSDREIFWAIARLVGAQPPQLELGGQQVSTLDELTDNFTVDIVDAFRSGELAAFLDKIGEAQLNKQLATIDRTQRNILVFEALCTLFQVEFDHDIAMMMFEQLGENKGNEGLYDTLSPASPNIRSFSSTALSEETARQLVRDAHSRILVIHTETLTESVAEILIRHATPTDLDWATHPLAERLFPLQLTFANLDYLRPEIAKILAKFPGVLEFSTLTDLTFEAAQYLANRTGGLRFNAIKTLAYEVWSVLTEEHLFGIYPAFIDVPKLETMDIAIARLLEQFKGDLYLGIPLLSSEMAEIFRRRPAKTVFWEIDDYPIELSDSWHLPDFRLYFPKLATFDRLTVPEAKHLVVHSPATGLADYPCELTLSLTSLDFKVATELAVYGDRLVFESLDTLTPDIARALSRHQFKLRDNFYQVDMGAWLSFPALKKLSRECMNYLIHGQLHAYFGFDGLETLSLDLAKEVSELRQSCLLLNGLSSLEARVAEQLAQMQDVQLHLNGLQSIDETTAMAFCRGNGFLCLFLGNVYPPSTDVRRILTFYFSGYLMIKGMVWYKHRSRHRVMSVLYPEFLGTSPIIDPYPTV